MKNTEIKTKKDSQLPQLKTPQSIIHIKHKISLQQYKYWVLLLQELKISIDQKIDPDEDGFRSMSMEKLSKILGYTPNKSEIWNDLLKLKNETIAFNVLNKDKENEKYGAGFISEWKVSNSFIKFKFPSFLENVMKGLDEPKAIFSLINWEIFNHFTGKYEAIIYKLCKDYINSPGRRTPDMTLSDFREYIGVKPEEYQEFKEFNRRVISVPVKRINDSEVSDILVKSHIYREGRKVTGLYFSVEHKKQTALPFFDTDEDNIFKFAKVPIDPKLQEKYLSIRPKEEIILCIQRANEYGEELEKLGKKTVYGAIYRKSILEGWHTAIKEKEIQKEAKEKEIQKEKQAEEFKIKAQKIEQEESEKKKKNIISEFHSLSEQEQEGIRVIFESQTNSFVAKAWAREKEKNNQPENEPRFIVEFIRFYETYKANLKLDI